MKNNSAPPRKEGSSLLPHALLAVSATSLILACSSGLGKNLTDDEAETGVESPNLRSGFDLGFDLVGPESADGAITEYAIAGGVVPGITGIDQLEGYEDGLPFVFLAFVTDAAVDDPDGNGLTGGDEPSLDPEVTDDTNAGRDVIIAAIPGLDLAQVDDPTQFLIGLDSRAFVQSVAPTMRHPRCTTCHSMKLPSIDDLDLDGDGNPDFGFPEHEAPTFPFQPGDNDTCNQCHGTITEEWLAPPLDTSMLTPEQVNFAGETNVHLFEAAQRLPGDAIEHFRNDERVGWALGELLGSPPGVVKLPANSGNGVADDDRDGIIEKEDTDGKSRSTPGGQAAVLARVQAWQDTEADYGELLFDNSERGIADMALASRSDADVVAANGESFSPELVYVPNPLYTQGGIEPAGSVFVVFASEATDLVSGVDSNGSVDVYRSEIQVFVDQASDGSALPRTVNLTFVEAVLVSESAGGGGAGNGSSGFSGGEDWSPVLGGAAGELVAFASDATDLVAGFGDNNGSEPDVFVRNMMTDEVALVSRSSALGILEGGSMGSFNPSISSGGRAVAFESDATDLDATGPQDTNGVRDVFLAELVPNGNALTVNDVRRVSLTMGGFEGSGGDSRAPSVFVFDEGTGASPIQARVAFESQKMDLVALLPEIADTSVYMRDDVLGTTVLLNQAIRPEGVTIGHATQRENDDPAPADSRNPVISQDGNSVVFETLAENIDVVRADDENYDWDVMVADLTQWESDGLILPFRTSITSLGGDANGASTNAKIGTFPAGTPFPFGLGIFQTDADNLGTADGLPLVALFLAEKGGLSARFDVDGLTELKTGPPPITLRFNDRSTGSPATWSWDFDGDGDEDSSQQNPEFRFTQPGTFTVSLVVTGDLGTDTTTQVLRILDPSDIADFSVMVVSGDAEVGANGRDVSGIPPFTLQFTDLTLDDMCPETWSWDFDGDGVEDSSERIPAPVDFTDFGSFNASLVVSTVAGDSDPATGVIGAFEPVVASFTPGDTDVVRAAGSPLTIDFDSSATTGAVDTYDWVFGTGANPGTSNLPNPTVQFPPMGTYAVSLEVSGLGNDSSTTGALVRVFEQVQAAAMLSDPADGIGAGGVTPFSATSMGSTGSIAGTEWVAIYPDGSEVLLSMLEDLPPTTIDLPPGTSSTPVNVDLELRLTGDVGDSGATNVDTDSVALTLYEAVTASFTTDPADLNNPPLSAATMVDFDASASSGDIVSFEWFDDPAWMPGMEPDNMIGSGQLFSFTFDIGSHQAILKVTGEGRDAAFTAVPFTVGSVVDFMGVPTSGVVPLTVAFTNLSSTDARGWLWDFGDGTTSTDKDPMHTYSAVGTYTVRLDATTAAGARFEQKDDYIVVDPPPVVAEFSGDDLSGPAPHTVNFIDLSTGSPTSWAWDFGDGNTSTAQSPTHVYVTAGTYTVELIATGAGGSDTETKSNYISVQVVAEFSGDILSGPAPHTVNFTDLSTGSPTSWAWDFGDGNTSTAQNPTHVYATAGCYDVSLTVSRGGSSSMKTESGFVMVGPTFQTVYNDWAACVSCHRTGSGLYSGTLLMDTVQVAFDNLQKPTEKGCLNLKRVEPCDPTMSSLFKAVDDNGCGLTMLMTGANVTLIEDWIKGGARR